MCGEPGTVFYESPPQLFFKCDTCFGIFVPSPLLPKKELEVERYLTHNNDVNDVNYQNFVAPIVRAVVEDFQPEKHVGLDYGAGTGPVITKVLSDRNYKIFPFDPFFQNDQELLEKKYDFIVCCEVMEHFHQPAKEFERLKSLLNPEGKLYCMTHLYSPEIPFANWYYKNDPTHVFIYQRKTLFYLRETVGFSQVQANKRLIIFSR